MTDFFVAVLLFVAVLSAAWGHVLRQTEPETVSGVYTAHVCAVAAVFVALCFAWAG